MQSHLNKAAENLNISANDVVGSCCGDPSELAAASSKYGDRFIELLDAGVNMAAQWKVGVVMVKFIEFDGLCKLFFFFSIFLL